MTARQRFAIGTTLLVSAVAYLIYSGVQQSGMYYLTIEEFFAQKAAMADQGIRIAGRVKPGSVTRQMTPTGEEFTFDLWDFHSEDFDGDAPSIPVYYLGVAPDMFKSEGGSDVIVEGMYRQGTLHAQSVMTSCPSKYEAEDEAGYGEAAAASPS